MANVQIKIDSQKFTIACGEGQEEKLKRIAAMLDEKVAFIKSRMLVSESMGLVMGALLLASDLIDQDPNLYQFETRIAEKDLLQSIQMIEKASSCISSVAETIENA